MTRRARPPLGLTLLEDRATPATAIYAAGTLTVTAAGGDNLVVGLTAQHVPGFLEVFAGPSIFTSGADRPVRNLVVRPAGTANTYGLAFAPDVALTNLAVTGAPFGTNVLLLNDTRVSGTFTFLGSPAATGNDNIWGLAGVRVGGSVALALGGGNNAVSLDGGEVGGSVSVTGGAGNDTINLLNLAQLHVGGSVTLALGNGFNQVLTAGGVLEVGRNFTYTGGSGDDHIDLTTNNARVRVAGSVGIDMPPAAGPLVIPAKYWRSDSLFVGGNFTVRRALFVDTRGQTFIGGNLTMTANPGGGSALGVGESTPLNPTTAAAVVGGAVTYTGGAADDRVSLDNLTVGRGVTVTLGGGGGMQEVNVGATQNARVTIAGGLTVSAAGAHTAFSLMRTSVGGALTVTGGAGQDRNWIDDTDVGGAARFDLGGGDDTMHIDIATVDGTPALNPLPLPTRFQAGLTFRGGAGADNVSVGSPGGGTGVYVGGPVSLRGGADFDTLTVRPVGNLYLQPTFEDFEFGDNL